MSKPDYSGDILRAIAGSYRRQVGPAKAEQLVNRAMARANAHTVRSSARRILAPTLALGVTLLAVGVVVLVGDNSPVSEPAPPAPVASAPAPQEQIAEVVASPVVSIPTQELEEALDLITQQKELEAAEVVVRALSAIESPVAAESDNQEGSPTPTAEDEAAETPTRTAAVTGGVPPEQSTLQGSGATESEEPESTEAEASSSGGSDPQPVTTQSQPTIEELGQVLKVEVEELLSADPQNLAEAAEKARNAATPILEYGQEPSILLPADE